MERRKAYIITALIILLLLTGLAFWYLYIAKQDLKIGQTTELKTYNIGEREQNQLDSSNITTSPFGDTSKSTTQTKTNQDTLITEVLDTEPIEPEEIPESWTLIQIHSQPTVGISIKDGEIYYVDQKTGHVYKNAKSGVAERISGVTVSQVQSAYQMPDSTIVFIKNNTQPTQITITDSESVESALEIFDPILQSVESGGYVYYTTPSQGGGIAVKSTKDPLKTLWSSPLSQWQLQAVDDSITITQNASYNIPGYAYLINKNRVGSTTRPDPVAQDLPGLITNISPNGLQLLYSTSGKNGTGLYLKNLETGEIIPLSLQTLASKCAWGDSALFYCGVPTNIPKNLPDSWYKGQVHFTDSLWRINAVTGDAFELAHNTDLDILEVVPSVVGDMVAFKNKTDQSLWAVIKN